jgi:hypothetical protein
LVVLIIECTHAICRVPYLVLSLRLSILYLRTCVGLGYGNKCIVFLNQYKLAFLHITHQITTLVITLRGRFKPWLLNISMEPSRIRREVL